MLATAIVGCHGELDAPTAAAAGGSSGQGGGGGSSPIVDAGPDAPAVMGDPEDLLKYPLSCVFKCPGDCAESTTPYACPALAPWQTLPHADSCAPWDGTFPKTGPTQCKASLPTGDAAKYAGPDVDHPGSWIMPGGRRVTPAGKEWVFAEPDLDPIQPEAVMTIPGTSWLLVADAGDGPHTVRVVDRKKLEAGQDPTLSLASWDAPLAINIGVVFVLPNHVLVPTAQGKVEALSLDMTKGTLSKDDARTIPLPMSHDDTGKVAPYYVAALAVSPDQKTLLVTSVFDPLALVFDLGAATWGKQLGTVTVPKGGVFAAAFDPASPGGSKAYATMWGGHKLIELDLATPSAPSVVRSFAIDKNPQGIAFLDARWVAIANDFGDSIALADRVTGMVSQVPVTLDGLPGLDPSTLAFDATRQILYATLAGVNAVAAWSVDTTATPPKLALLGRLPTSWWPSGVAVLDDGALAVTTMRGHTVTPVIMPDGPQSRLSGTIALVPAPSLPDLAAADAVVTATLDASALAGAPKVTCPPGVSDFPVPGTNTEGKSKQIEHVIIVLRENKTFDSLLGDLPGVNGAPALVLKKGPGEMDAIWGNLRALSKTFAMGDNYYTESELSNQGHTWMTFARTSDFTERTWTLNNYSRSTWASPVQPQGTSDIGSPSEGSAFDWLLRNKVSVDVLGEAEGAPSVPSSRPVVDTHYPGGFVQSISRPDIEKACYVAGRARAVCDLAAFTYMTLPNDHTAGTGPTSATPETMIATNDEATGMLMDAISHGPMWEKTLIIVVEDDPGGSGNDHVERHRSPSLFVSPWVKRGYVTKTNLDEASLYKIVAHVFGVPYPNEIVKNASIPFDLFSDTPDYAPYTYTPRTYPRACGTQTTAAEAQLSETWNFDHVDSQPGLDAQVMRHFAGKPLTAAPKQAARPAKPGRRHVEDDDDDD